VQLYPQPLYTASQVRTTSRSWDKGVLTELCLTLCNAAHVYCTLNNYDYKHTLRIVCNTYCLCHGNDGYANDLQCYVLVDCPSFSCCNHYFTTKTNRYGLNTSPVEYTSMSISNLVMRQCQQSADNAITLSSPTYLKTVTLIHLR